MKDFEKEIENIFLDDEEDTLRRIKLTYDNSLKDVQAHAKKLQAELDDLVAKVDVDDVIGQSQIRAKIYQLDYQKKLEKQINNYMDIIKDKDVKTINDYLNRTYSNGFLTEQYRLMNEGINITMPINQKLLTKAVTFKTDNITLSERLYENVTKAKKEIINEISRGLSTGMSVTDMSRNIANTMGVGQRKAYQIAQNESQRVRQSAIQDSMFEAKKKGADIVKVWSATLDGRTRTHHRELDGKWAEIGKKFKFSGGEVNAPKEFGIASEDINCRCTLLSVPRWDLTDKHIQRDNETGELVEVSNYQDWYDNIYSKTQDVVSQATNDVKKVTEKAKVVIQNSEGVQNVINKLKAEKIEYNQAQSLSNELTEQEIIDRLGGGDLTEGSCSSLCIAYTGNKNGLDVLDFRGGRSREIFSRQSVIDEITKMANGTIVKNTNDFKAVKELLTEVKEGKEYCLSTGRHASIIRKVGDNYEYLELQSATNNGWHVLNDERLKHRFGCSTKHTRYGKKIEYNNSIYDIDKTNNDLFSDLLGYINTATGNQMKGVKGSVK